MLTEKPTEDGDGRPQAVREIGHDERERLEDPET